MHRIYLDANSRVFKNMLQLGEAVKNGVELPKVQLDEVSATLELGLPYVHPRRLEPYKLNLSSNLSVIRLDEKYEVSSSAGGSNCRAD